MIDNQAHTLNQADLMSNNRFFARIVALVAKVGVGLWLAGSWLTDSWLAGGLAIADEPLRIGIIGLDTSHVTAFTKLINSEEATGNLAKMQVVAAYPGGSDDLASSRDRVAGFTEAIQGMGVEIVESIDELLTKVDAVLLESVDGRKHLSQAIPVFRAGKPVFIDKPLAGDLADAIAIDLAAKKYQARWFSSSSLRFSPSIIRYRDNAELQGTVVGATAWSPCSLDPTHSDLFWYGIHGVEILYTVMGSGCQQVTRMSSPGTDVVVGMWDGGRIGTFRGIRQGKADYGLVVFGEQAIDLSGKYEGYGPLVERIAEFFLGAETPVPTAETIEMMTFMQAADSSKHAGGQLILLSDVYSEALKEAEKRLAAADKE